MVIPRTIFTCLVIALVTGCKTDARTPPGDSAIVTASSSSPPASHTGNDYSILAGDTLQLVSVGGRSLAPPVGVALACDSAHTPLRQQLVLSSDSTYWGVTVARPGCRDTVERESDTVAHRGAYAISGDTIFIYSADPTNHSELAGLVFSDSVVQTGTTPNQVWRYSRRQGAAGDPAEMGPIRTDSVLLANDIDGSGKTDYVVREARGATNLMAAKEYRLAIYLDTKPRSRPPDWKNDWDMEAGKDQGLSKFLSLAPGVSFLEVQWSGGDFDGDDVLIAEKGKVLLEIYHGIDYGNGYFLARQEGGKTLVEASLDNLDLLGKPVTSAIKCPAFQVAGMRLVFDPNAGHFVRDAAVQETRGRLRDWSVGQARRSVSRT